MGNTPSSQPGRNTAGKLQPLGGVQGHDGDRVVARPAIQVHHQGHVLQIGLQRIELGHGLDQLLQVLQPRLALRAAVCAQHVGVAALFEDGFEQFRVLLRGGERAPAVHVAHEVGQGGAGLRRQFVGVHEPPRRQAAPERSCDLAPACISFCTLVSPMPRLGWLTMRSKARSSSSADHQPQIGVGVADLGALEEARAADHRVGDLQHDEPLFERAHLERGPHQHRAVLVAALRRGLLPALDLVGDHAGLGLAVPHAAHGDLLAVLVLGPQRLAKAALVAPRSAPEAAPRICAGWSGSCAPGAPRSAPSKSRSKRRMLSISAPRQP